MYVRIKAKPVNVSLQVYAPTLAASEEADEFYMHLQEEINSHPCQDIVFVAGDFNAKVGEDTRSAGVDGQYGPGETNGNGEKLINFCQENSLVITNTLFQHHKRRRYTWCSPDGKTRNQIDYILVKRQFLKLCQIQQLFQEQIVVLTTVWWVLVLVYIFAKMPDFHYGNLI